MQQTAQSTISAQNAHDTKSYRNPTNKKYGKEQSKPVQYRNNNELLLHKKKEVTFVVLIRKQSVA